jgi:hypothetical protein
MSDAEILLEYLASDSFREKLTVVRQEGEKGNRPGLQVTEDFLGLPHGFLRLCVYAYDAQYNGQIAILAPDPDHMRGTRLDQ